MMKKRMITVEIVILFPIIMSGLFFSESFP